MTGLRAGLAALLLLIGFPLSAEEDVASPALPVELLEHALLANLHDSGGFQQRFARLRPLLDEIMAVERMARYLFGPEWPDFDVGMREQFVETFLDLSAATYADQFDEFGGERFEALAVERSGEDRAVVKRQLITGSGRQIAFDYLVIRNASGWQIVTIIADGVSDLAVKRSQYRKMADAQGLAGVIEQIERQVAKQRGD